MLTIHPASQPATAPRTAAPTAVRPASIAYQADTLQLTRRSVTPVARPSSLSPGQKIALLAAPVALGAGIGFALGGPLGALAGAGVGAVVSVVGLWWAMTDKPWGNKPGTPETPPEH